MHTCLSNSVRSVVVTVAFTISPQIELVGRKSTPSFMLLQTPTRFFILSWISKCLSILVWVCSVFLTKKKKKRILSPAVNFANNKRERYHPEEGKPQHQHGLILWFPVKKSARRISS